MQKFGYLLTVEGDDCIWWEDARCMPQRYPVVETYDDHRMAMSFAPAAALTNGVIVRFAEVVSKSYPQFWDDLRAAGYKVIDVKDLQTSQ
jgi:3-phosphoshikimate 1-carboxyvinyltransferase